MIGDLSSADETRDLARSCQRTGHMDAVIHNAGIYVESTRAATSEGHARTVAVNTLAPYMLTALIDRPDRLGLSQQRNASQRHCSSERHRLAKRVERGRRTATASFT